MWIPKATTREYLILSKHHASVLLNVTEGQVLSNKIEHPANVLFFGGPIYRAKDGTYVTRTIGCFSFSTYVVPRRVTPIILAVALALGGHNLFWAWHVWLSTTTYSRGTES